MSELEHLAWAARRGRNRQARRRLFQTAPRTSEDFLMKRHGPIDAPGHQRQRRRLAALISGSELEQELRR
jgi:hypothetical protein